MINIGISQKFKVDTLLSLGCKRWQKNDLDRLYLGEVTLYQLLGIQATYNNTGSLFSFQQDGETISSTQGNKVLASLKNCKFYYDVVSDAYGYKHCDGCVDLHNSVFRRLDEYLSSKYDTHTKAKAEREITLDEINAALGL